MNRPAVPITWMHQLVRGRLHAARGQNLVEYGLLVATIAIVSAAAFKALSSAEVAYFQGVQPGLAPTPATFSPLLPQTALSVQPVNGTFGGSASLSATLTSAGAPVAGKTISFTLNGTGVGSAITDGSGKATLPGVSLSGIPPGTYPNGVGASFAGDASFAASSGSNTLTITASTNTTASSMTVTFGASSVTLTANVTSAAGTVNNGSVAFTVTPVCTNSPFTGTVSNGQASATCNLAPGASVGSYAIQAAYTPGPGFQASNNSAQSPVPTLTIQQATPSLTVAAASGTYGGTVNLSATLAGVSGPLAGQTITFTLNGAQVCGGGGSQPACPQTNASGVATLTGVSLAGISANTYSTGVGASFAGNANYSAANRSAQLTVTQASLTITADNNTRVYGAPNPPFTATYTGFVNGDTPASLSGTLTCTTTAVTNSPVSGSPYPISCSGRSSVNYNITYANGTLTVTVASTSITSLTGSAKIGTQSSTLTAQVTAVSPSNATVNQGTVDFSITDQSGNVCTDKGVPVDSTGKAISTHCSPNGQSRFVSGTTYTIQATYNALPKNQNPNFSQSSTVAAPLTLTS